MKKLMARYERVIEKRLRERAGPGRKVLTRAGL